MNREKFQEVVDTIAGKEYYRDNKAKTIWNGKYGPRRVIYVEWETGGAQGGNCWGDEAHYYSVNDGEKELTDLYEILKEVCPHISFLQFMDLKKLIYYTDRTESEYYGNYTDYKRANINVDDLWNYLISNELVDNV